MLRSPITGMFYMNYEFPQKRFHFTHQLRIVVSHWVTWIVNSHTGKFLLLIQYFIASHWHASYELQILTQANLYAFTAEHCQFIWTVHANIISWVLPVTGVSHVSREQPFFANNFPSFTPEMHEVVMSVTEHLYIFLNSLFLWTDSDISFL